MNISKPFLALIGHGTTGKDKTGKDDIEPGIHLRWAFRREMGFPLGCFRLYRRQSGSTGTIDALTKLRKEKLDQGDRVPEIIIIDGRLRPSASRA